MDRPGARAEPAATPEWWRGRGALLDVIVALALIKVFACMAMVVIYRSLLAPGTFPALVPAAHVAVFAGAALFLATVGSRDRRALHLGAFFLLVAVSFANGLVHRLTGLEPTPQRVQEALLALHPDAFLPLFLWLFVAQFPRLHRFDRGQGVERIFLGAAVVLGTACFFASGVRPWAGAAASGLVSALGWARSGSGFDVVLFGLSFPALPFGLWKAGRADVRERRRYRIFVAGLLLGFLPLAVQVLAESLSPSYNAFMSVGSRRFLAGLILFPLFLSIPVTATYAVVVHRVLNVKLIVRKAVQYALARYTIAALTALLAVALAVALVRHRDESVGALLTTASGLSIVVPLVILIGLFWARRSLLDVIDRWFFREALDSRALLTELAATNVGETLTDICQVLSRRLQTSLHVAQADILVPDWERGTLRSATGQLRNMPMGGPLTTALSRRPEGVVVELDRPDSFLGRLPIDEQQWLADGGVHLLIPLTSGSDLVGALALGEKLSELPFSGEDYRLLAPVAAALALKIENLRLRGAGLSDTQVNPGSGPPSVEEPAQVCVTCSFATSSTSLSCPRCSGSVTPIQLPLTLAGKFRLERELGRGGMGVVYLAIDLELERRVAIKTLPRVLVAESVRLRREARAMAAFSHPHLALIFGIESWQGAPALIMEYLEGGTLADRLRQSRLTPTETAGLARELAGAISMIHDEGLLHRDIKPSNIAFTLAGRPKLLDFGLAEMFVDRSFKGPRPGVLADPRAWTSVSDLTTADHPGGFAGTPAYMAPEARSGQLLDGSADLWSLGVVLFECLIGDRPFKGPPVQRDFGLLIEEAVPDCPEALRELVADLLALDKRQRPKSAHAALLRLHEMDRSIQVA
ncbi:MAG: serine/threonine protein kinase [Vicinamibacteria bacterium]|nr:serine/threonine protein kinase [Vicinamibacteria bacterium]